MYLHWNQQTITDFSEVNVNSLYHEGYVFTRTGRGIMQQTRSLRVDLSQFALSSENRRILKKTESLTYTLNPIPPALGGTPSAGGGYTQYHWSIGKMGHDFYASKFGKNIFSANKIKELMTDPEKSNFNRVFVYTVNHEAIGYCIAFETDDLIHYAYPFYNLKPNTYNLTPNIGLGMMLRAILYAKESGKKYIYLGSTTRPSDTYKLQFAGVEWWDGKRWETDSIKLKKILS